MHKIERIAIEELGIPSVTLMGNAALRVVKHCLNYLKDIDKPKVLIVCGKGNNGGDGLIAARLLQEKGIETKTINAGDSNSEKFEQYDLIVDAILGTGLTRDIEGNFKNIIEEINRCAKYVISVDIPSGINSDTGRIMGCAVKASETVTFGFPKTGLYLYPGAGYAGKIHIEDISIPDSLIDRVKSKIEVLADNEAKALLPPRKTRSNKGDFGRVVVFAGSDEMPGAASLACSAAYMTGAGLVCACVMRNTASVIHHWQREVVTRITPGKNGQYCAESLTSSVKEEINNASAVVIGPGIGRSADVSEFVFEVLNLAKTPVVLDADALFAVSQNKNILKTLKAPCVITPHAGEMSRLSGLSIPEILDDIKGTAEKFAAEYNVVTLLKDTHTIIAAPDGNVYINTTGNDALSKAGTGDVLTGMISGFIAQFSAKIPAQIKDVFTAGILGAYFHGKAAEIACLKKSNYGVTASDIIDLIPIVMKK